MTKNSNVKSSRIKGKCVSIATALILMLAISVICIVGTPIAYAKITTYPYMSITPKTTGLNQFVLINAWVAPPPPLGSNGLPILRHNYTFSITKPDGSIETRIIADSDGPGSVWFTYTPTALGTYIIKFSWAGDDLFDACESPISTLTVQNEKVPSMPAMPLPTGYWERPISAENREWNTISGGWLSADRASPAGSGNNFNPYTTGPNSAHILWKKNVGIGGLVGGALNSIFVSPSASPIIMFGRAYYTTGGSIVCVDIHTGQELWKVTGSGILVGMPMYRTAATTGQSSGWSIGGLWALTAASFNLYDLYTGTLIRSVTGPGTGWSIHAAIDDTQADIIAGNCYIYLGLFNTTDSVRACAIKWDALVTSTTFQSHIKWIQNWTCASPNYIFFPLLCNGVLVMERDGANAKFGFNATTGEWIYNATVIPNQEVSGGSGYEKSYALAEDMRIHAYNIYTGEQVWASDPGDYPWGVFGPYGLSIGYDRVYGGRYDGNVYCLDAATGKTLWKYYVGNSTETPYGTWPVYGISALADGKIYEGTTEHTPTEPYLRGFRLYCLDAMNGSYIWSIAFSSARCSIGDGVLLSANGYDGYLYAFDKGQTTTTIAASQNPIPKGSGTMIQGSVIDQSPAQPGTPAISDQDMTAWMEYLHMEKPLPNGTDTFPYYPSGKPTNFTGTGVPVKLTAIDSNGNAINIGTATSDASGNYAILWTPPAEGTYKIIASFEGSNSYYSSYAETAVGVTAAPSPSIAQTATASPSASMTASESGSPSNSATLPGTSASIDMYITIAAAAVIIVVIAVAAVILRRRK